MKITTSERTAVLLAVAAMSALEEAMSESIRTAGGDSETVEIPTRAALAMVSFFHDAKGLIERLAKE